MDAIEADRPTSFRLGTIMPPLGKFLAFAEYAKMTLFHSQSLFSVEWSKIAMMRVFKDPRAAGSEWQEQMRMKLKTDKHQ